MLNAIFHKILLISQLLTADMDSGIVKSRPQNRSRTE